MQPETSTLSQKAQFLSRWAAHLSSRGAAIPTRQTFLAFGRLSTLERLAKVLAGAAPECCGPLRAAIQDLRAEKRRRAGSKAKGTRRGPAIKVTIPAEELPPNGARLSRA